MLCNTRLPTMPPFSDLEKNIFLLFLDNVVLIYKAAPAF